MDHLVRLGTEFADREAVRLAGLTELLWNCPSLDETFVQGAVARLKLLLSDPLDFWSNAEPRMKPFLALTYFPNRIVCENGTLRTSELLGIPRSLAAYNDAGIQAVLLGVGIVSKENGRFLDKILVVN